AGRKRVGSTSRRARRAPTGSSLPEGRRPDRRRSARAGRPGSGRRYASRLERLLEKDGRALKLRLVLVGGVEVPDRALAGPLGGQEEYTNERRVLGRRRGREHHIVGALEPGVSAAIRVRLAVAVDGQLAL